jgi:hypothetical protein
MGGSRLDDVNQAEGYPVAVWLSQPVRSEKTDAMKGVVSE